jgi:hypothetical protein
MPKKDLPGKPNFLLQGKFSQRGFTTCNGYGFVEQLEIRQPNFWGELADRDAVRIEVVNAFGPAKKHIVRVLTFSMQKGIVSTVQQSLMGCKGLEGI